MLDRQNTPPKTWELCFAPTKTLITAVQLTFAPQLQPIGLRIFGF